MSIAPVSAKNVARLVDAARRRPRSKEHAYLIEGEYLCARDIAERLNVKKHVVNKRLADLRKQPGAITWARLKGAV